MNISTLLTILFNIDKMSMYNYILRFSVGFSIMSMVDVDALNNKNNIINRKVTKVYLNHPKG